MIAAEASPEDPIANVHQISLAKQLRCSTKTISRAIAELVKNDLLCEAGKWQHGRCKTYQLNWNPRVAKEETPMKVDVADAQLSIPSEYYIRVGPDSNKREIEIQNECVHEASVQHAPAVLEPEEPVARELSEAEQECEWIVAQIKESNDAQRRKEDFEAKKNAAFGARGRVFAPKSMLPPIDEPITPQNYPIMWEFLSIQWANRKDKRVA